MGGLATKWLKVWVLALRAHQLKPIHSALRGRQNRPGLEPGTSQ